MDTHVFENFTVSWAMRGTDEDTWLTSRERGEMAAERAEKDRMPEYGAYALIEEDIEEESESAEPASRKKKKCRRTVQKGGRNLPERSTFW